jgi:hypothetical protein
MGEEKGWRLKKLLANEGAGRPNPEPVGEKNPRQGPKRFGGSLAGRPESLASAPGHPENPEESEARPEAPDPGEDVTKKAAPTEKETAALISREKPANPEKQESGPAFNARLAQKDRPEQSGGKRKIISATYGGGAIIQAMNVEGAAQGRRGSP